MCSSIRKQRFLTLTMNPTVDISTEVAKLEPQRKLRCGQPRLYPGGGGVNVARMLHRLGEKVVALYPYGGFSGSRLRQMLKKEHIEQRPIPIRGETRESFMVTEAEQSDVYRFVLPGPTLSSSEAGQCLAVLQDELEASDFLVVSGSLPGGLDQAFYGRVAAIAKATQVPMLLDAPPPQILDALVQGVALLRLNQTEFEELAESPSLTARQAQQQALRILDRYPIEALIVTLPQGAFLATRHTIYGVTAPRVHKRNPSGAGDCFVAGFVSRWLRNPSPNEALSFGVACAAAAMGTEGGELADLPAIEELTQRVSRTKRVQADELQAVTQV